MPHDEGAATAVPMEKSRMNALNENLKRIFDCAASCGGMVVFSPLYLAIYIAIKCESKGPAIFKQERIGRGGKPFTLYKFRSMKATSESDGKPALCQQGDERLTKVGKFIREHHLDELPQLWNVAKGDMSGSMSFARGSSPTRPSTTVTPTPWRKCSSGLTMTWNILRLVPWRWTQRSSS